MILSGGRTVAAQSSTHVALREAITEVSRQVEDLGWVNIGSDVAEDGIEESLDDRRKAIKRARIMARRNPLAKQADSLLKHYTLGGGVTLRANNKALVARLVDEFWDHPVNKVTFTGHQAMKESLGTLFSDGNLFLVLFPDKDNGTLELGLLNAMDVEDIITDPENRKIPRWYKVKDTKRTFDWKNGTYDTDATKTDPVYYRDWRNDEEEGDAEEGRPAFAPPKSMQRDGLIYHIAVNKRGKFGDPELLAALDWIKAHKDFMEDRATINRAAASVAWKKKRKGPAADIAAEVERIRSSLSLPGGRIGELNPPPATASTVVENEGSTLEWVKTDTGGQAASADERVLRMMTGSGMGGVPNHYFGDEANANLATATAMELPLLKTYEDWQTLLTQVIKDLVEFMLSVAFEAGRVGERDNSRRYADRVTTPQEVIMQDDQLQEAEGDVPVEPPQIRPARLVMTGALPEEPMTGEEPDTDVPVDWYVDVDFPPIVQKALPDQVAALTSFAQVLPGENIESRKLVVEMFLTALGVNDIEEMMERIFPPTMKAVLAPEAPPPKPQDIAAEVANILQGNPTKVQPGSAEREPAPAAGVAESDDNVGAMAAYRIRRLLSAVSEAEHADRRTAERAAS